MDELERLYNELPYFDKQKFIGRHLADARQEDIDDAVEDGMQKNWNKMERNVTNKEKALVLSSMNRHDFSVEESNAAYNAALAMAEWKDEEFAKEKQALIDKACEWLRKNTYEGTCEQILSKKTYPFMSDFIEEFKNAMKGGKE